MNRSAELFCIFRGELGWFFLVVVLVFSSVFKNVFGLKLQVL